MTSPMHSPLQSPLQPVMRSPLEFRRRGGGFNIASTNPSAYYDRSVLASMFQDSAGTIAIPDSGYSIGYGGDLSGDGNNQIQATAGKRPILMQSPAGGVRNLLTYTEDFGNAVWAKLAGATAVGDTITVSSGDGTCEYLYAVPGGSAGKTFTVSAWLSGTGVVRLKNTHAAVVDSFSADITLTGTPTLHTLTVTNNASAGNGNQNVGITTAATPVPFSATCKIQLELGSTATPYQKVTNQYTVTEEGVPSVWSAKFDAVDDDLGATFPSSLGAGCTVCRSLPGTGASITTGVTIGTTYTDNVDAHFLAIYTAAQWAALDAGQIANITALLNAKAGL